MAVFKKPAFIKLSERQLINLASLLIILIALPLAVFLVGQRQELRKKAAGVPGVVSDIALAVYCPNHLAIPLDDSCPFSALAQSADGRFIWQGISYEWGISSQNSIGTLSPVNGPVTTLFAENEGYGDLWVIATQEDGTKVHKSIGVNAGSTPSTPTPIGCRQSCGPDAECPSGWMCGTPCPEGQVCSQYLWCYNPACPYDRDCICDGAPTPIPCVPEGQTMPVYPGYQCCQGLVPISPAEPDESGNCPPTPIVGASACTKCGLDGQCGLGENKCNCPEDCPSGPTSTPTPVSTNCVSFENIRINNCTKDKWEQSPRHLDCYTSNPAVTINLNSPRATQIRFGVPPSFDFLCSNLDESYWYRWENYAPISVWNAWRHSPGVGDKKICVQFGNAAGLSQKCSGAITIVTGTPTPTQTPDTAKLDFKVKLQGINQQKPSMGVKIVLKKDGVVIKVFENTLVVSDADGIYSGSITDIAPNIYDIYIKGWAHLQKKFENITLAEGENNQDFSGIELLAGDANGDNRISIQDIRIAVLDYIPNVVPSSPANFNLDGMVNIQDIRLIIINYFKEGD